MIKNARNAWKEKIRLNYQFMGFKNGRLNYKCKQWKKSYTKLTNESIKTFPTLYKFCNGDLEKIFLLIRKCIYPYEYIDSRKNLMKIEYHIKKLFYGELNLESISDADYEHVPQVWEAFEIKDLGEYHDLYVQSNTLLLEDVY